MSDGTKRSGRPLAWGRLIGVAAVILGSGALLALGALPLALSPWMWRRFRAGLFRATCRALLRLLRFEVRVSGPPPRAPYLLVSNHLSYLDVIVLASRLPARFVAKEEVRSWPVLGLLCKGFGTIFIDRADRRDIPRVLSEILESLLLGEGVILFPEGTSSSGDEVRSFRSPLLAQAAHERMPVHAAALRYRTPEGEPPARDAVCWWGEVPLFSHLLGLFRLSKVEAFLDFAPEPVVDEDRKRLAERLREVVVERMDGENGP
jgi:1-acyl-sn-glycerol-3-phosphate acyltransferase